MDRDKTTGRDAEAIGCFLVNTDPLIAELQEAMGRHDFHAMNRAVRRLRALSTLVNEPAIAAAATRFENAFSRADDASLPGFADQLCLEVRNVQNELRNEPHHSRES
jgi:HPt (histidine-containing phosphotransfer) domain-containing protein